MSPFLLLFVGVVYMWVCVCGIVYHDNNVDSRPELEDDNIFFTEDKCVFMLQRVSVLNVYSSNQPTQESVKLHNYMMTPMVKSVAN